jgi:hypothetical protein
MLATYSSSDIYIEQRVAEGLFKELLSNKFGYRVLNIYGDNGVGKTTLKEHLIDRYTDGKDIIAIDIDLNNRILHNSKNAVIYLAKKLEKRYSFDFVALWKAYAILWSKRFEKSLLLYGKELPYIYEVKKLVEEDRRSNYFFNVLKELFSPSIIQELEKLNDLETQEIEARLHKFFASDLKNIASHRGLKELIFFIDGYDLINERVGSECINGAWIRDLIIQLGKDAIFVINSKKELSWSICNSAWKSQIHLNRLKGFNKSDASRYLTHIGILDEKLRLAIIKSSRLNPFWLSLSKYTYFRREERLPESEDDIFTSFINNQTESVIAILKVLSHTRVFTKDTVDKIANYLKLEIDNNFIIELFSFDFIKYIGDRKYTIDKILKDRLIQLESKDKNEEYQAFLFSYYENILYSLDKELIKSSPELIDETLEEAWHFLRKIKITPDIHFEWLNYYVVRFFLYAAWEPFIERYREIEPHFLKEFKDNEKLAREKLIVLYNNLAALYEAIGEYALSKSYYEKFIKLSRDGSFGDIDEPKGLKS